MIGFRPDEVVYVSAKEGTNIDRLLDGRRRAGPAAVGRPGGAAGALIFDSKYDSYKGVIAYVRVMDGRITGRERLRLMATRRTVEPLETGTFRPMFFPTEARRRARWGTWRLG